MQINDLIESELNSLEDLELWKDNFENNLKYIEFWEYYYLEQLYFILRIERERMINALNNKENIRMDWVGKLSKKRSENAVGSERIFYWLFNQFGIPNSTPVGSDLVFETHNAFIHIDIKSVYANSNMGDVQYSINVGKNQTSYKGFITYKKKNDVCSFKELYHPNLPSVYTKKDKNGNVISKKICLSYFIVIVNEENEKNIQTIILTCMPNGNLSQYYEKDLIVSKNNVKQSLLAPGKNYSEARYRYFQFKKFELLDSSLSRFKILYWNDNVLNDILENYDVDEDFLNRYWFNEINDKNLKKSKKNLKDEDLKKYNITKDTFLKIRNLKEIHKKLSHLKEIYDIQEENEKK